MATARRRRSRPRGPRRWGAGGPAPRRRRLGPPAGRGRRPQRCAASPGAHRCGGPGAEPPVRPLLPQRRETPGVRRGGAASPRQTPMWAHWVGWLSCPRRVNSVIPQMKGMGGVSQVEIGMISDFRAYNPHRILLDHPTASEGAGVPAPADRGEPGPCGRTRDPLHPRVGPPGAVRVLQPAGRRELRGRI